MTPVHTLLSELERLGVRLGIEGEQLKVRARPGVMTKPLVEQLQHCKSEVMALLRAAGPSAADPPVAPPATVLPAAVPRGRDRLPVSFAQRRFWFLDQLGSGATYNLAGWLELRGPLDSAVLHRALQAVVDRHEVLRTTYQASADEVVQVVAATVVLPLSVVDLSALPAAERDAEVARRGRLEAQRPFDLSRDLMLRTTLLRLAEEAHDLLFTIHHIAADAWSLTIFVQELTLLYNAFAAGQPNPLPALGLQYGDFAAWQRRRELDADLAYWQRKLSAPPPLPELPLDFRPPLVQDYRGGRVKASLSPELMATVRALARQQEATPFIVLVAVFKLLLHRYTGQEDIVIGSPSIGRSLPESERLIGLFLNLLALRTSLSGNPSFRVLLQRTREVVLDAFSHQEAPFEKVVELVQPDRIPGRDPLFEVMLNYVNIPPRSPELSQLRVTTRESAEPDALRALTIYAYETGQALELELVYQRALFSESRMSCFLDQFVALLSAVTAEPDRPLSAYSLVTPTMRARLPELRAEIPAPPHAPITERLRDWAGRTPLAVAVEADGIEHTYAQLLHSAERIATVLLHHGLRRGEVVAVHGARCFGTIASLFGVLLSGCVMLPLEVDLPPLRQRRMLEIGRARLVLVVGTEDSPALSHLEGAAWQLLPVDGRSGQLPGPADPLPLPELAGSDPAYIMFTSGTTGEPKGILGVHRGPAHFLAWQRTTFGIGPGARCAQCAGLSFELMLRDVFLAPTSGATLCLPARQLQLDGAGFLDWLVEQRITLLHPVPSLAQGWLQHAAADYRCTTLRHSLFLGEPLSDTLVQRWRRHFPGSAVHNFYGPSETTMAKCCFAVPEPPPPGIQPVGWPLPDTQALVLNSEDRLCGVGEPGQIVLRTPFRTLGYVNPTQNERRFVPNPERNDPQDLLYYSGDRGRYRPDGAIEILGRVDHEIKIRGVRIQPGEISAVLEQHPALSACTVVVYSEGDEKKIAAYVVAREGQSPAVKELRHYLGQRLPSALVPSAFVFVPALPVTSNGKIDRDALPPPVVVSSERFAVPRNERERQMAELWQQLLGVHSVGIHDNFFELGGHSLIAVHLMARIQQVFGQNLPLSTLFAYPTVETLAAHLAGGADSAPWPTLVAIQPRGRRPPLFCAPGAGGNVLYLYQLARYLGPEQPFYGLQAAGLDGKTPPHPTVEAMAADYVAAVKRVQPRGPYHLAGHSFGGQVVFEMAQQLLRAGDAVAFVALLDSSPPTAANPDLPRETDEADMLGEMASILGFMAGREGRLSAAALRSLSAEERLAQFQREMEAAGLLPANTDPRQVRGWLSVFKTGYQIWYEPRDVRPLRVVYFCASQHPPELKERRLGGWRRYGSVERYDIAGSHSSILVHEPHVRELAAKLSQLLAGDLNREVQP